MSKASKVNELKTILEHFDPESIQDLESARVSLRLLLNLVEEVTRENQALRQEVQSLRDEVNRLKGEQGKPDIKPPKGERPDHSSDKERHEPQKRSRSRKLNKIVVHREQKLEVDKSQLPADAESKGYVEVVVQDIEIKPNNTRFLKEKYYSASQGKTYLAPMPPGYDGEFGPGVRSLVISLYYGSGMTEPKIVEFLSNFDISISAGQVSNFLVKGQESWHEEKAQVVAAGLASTEWQHTDDTGTRVNGENQYCHIFCNPYYTAYFTRPHKNRLTVIHLLQGTETVQFLLNPNALAWKETFKTPQWALKVASQWPQEPSLTQATLEEWIARDLDKLNDQQQARILESAALAAYYSQQTPTHPVIPILLSDDAPQFRDITPYHALCWVHEGRLYKKLMPFLPYHQLLLDNFQTDFWGFYHQLLAYRSDPSPPEAQRLHDKFDDLFSTTTGYQALDQRIAKTKQKADKLLLVLDFPDLPLHNNPAELGARQRVRKRHISFGPRTQDGVQACDTFMTLAETAKKLGVSFFAYVYDRVSGASLMPSLAQLIQNQIPAQASS